MHQGTILYYTNAYNRLYKHQSLSLSLQEAWTSEDFP